MQDTKTDEGQITANTPVVDLATQDIPLGGNMCCSTSERKLFQKLSFSIVNLNGNS